MNVQVVQECAERVVPKWSHDFGRPEALMNASLA